jgi:hypothetical protein
MLAVADRFHAQQVAGHVEAANRLLAALVHLHGLEVAEADGIQAVEAVAGLVQRLIAVHTATARNDLVKAGNIFVGQALWQAQAVKAAQRAFRCDRCARLGGVCRGDWNDRAHDAAPCFRWKQYLPWHHFPVSSILCSCCSGSPTNTQIRPCSSA